MLRHTLFLIFLSVLLISGCKISGKVMLDGKPVEGAAITLSGDAKRTATTNSFGVFTFNNLGRGTYTISVDKCGVSPEAVRITKQSRYTDVTGVRIDAEPLIWEGDYTIGDADDLEAISGYSLITGTLSISTNALKDLKGLECLTEIQGGLYLSRNYSLASLEGLTNLETIGGNLMIDNNDGLTNLDGLKNLTLINGSLYMIYNDALMRIKMDSLSDVGGEFIVMDNSNLCDNYGYHLLNAIRSRGHIGGLTRVYNNKVCD